MHWPYPSDSFSIKVERHDRGLLTKLEMSLSISGLKLELRIP